MAGSLVRDVVERHNRTGSPASNKFVLRSTGSSSTGFPAVQHRSKATSAFKRAKEDERVQNALNASRDGFRNANQDDTSDGTSKVPTRPAGIDLMDDISEANTNFVASMHAEDRARERADIIDKFGPGIHDLITKVREARERRATTQTPVTHDDSQSRQGSNIASAQSSTPSTPRTRAARKIRFLEPTEADVHVYESQPPSPKRVLGMLPPPPENSQERADILSLGTFKGVVQSQGSSEAEAKELPSSAATPENDNSLHLEEGTPEDIRRRFFPSEPLPETVPSLAWMLPLTDPSINPYPFLNSDSSTDQKSRDVEQTSDPRYSLSGTQLTPSQIRDLPTHLGLHHHASNSSDVPAGYTLSDLILLARSSVPAQRASVLGVLAKILRNTYEHKYAPRRDRPSFTSPTFQKSEYQSNGDLEVMKQDVLSAAIDALGEKGGVGQRAMDVLWEVVVGCLQAESGVVSLDDFASISLISPSFPPSSSGAPSPQESQHTSTPTQSPAPLSVAILMSLPITRLLPALRQHLTISSSPLSRTHSQVLDILLVLSHFPHHAQTITNTEEGAGVISAMLRPHLGSSSNVDEEIHATPTSIRILQVLASSSRDNALKLTGPADVLLRYITMPLPLPVSELSSSNDPYSGDRPTLLLLEETLRLYIHFSQYGLYAHMATIAQDHFKRIGSWLLDAQHTLSKLSLKSLLRTYLCLLQTWIVCATDPHKTMPNHDILWSQVQGWGWAEWIMDFAQLLDLAPESLSPSHYIHSGAYGDGIDISDDLWASVCHAIASWLEGASVNGVKGGEGERASVLERIRPLFSAGHGASGSLQAALMALQDPEPKPYSNTQTIKESDKFAHATDLVTASLRLTLACIGPETKDVPLDIPAADIHRLCLHFLDNVPEDLSSHPIDTRHNVSKHTHTLPRRVSALLVHQLQFWWRSMNILAPSIPGDFQEVEWAAQALHVLTRLVPGDEHYANWIMETMCDNMRPDFVQKLLPDYDSPPEMWDRQGMKILLPFLTHSLRPTRPSGEDESRSQTIYVAPLFPTPKSIAQCTTLNVPSPSHFEALKLKRDLVLPLDKDWPMWPLNHLLRSGISPVFHTLPPSWDASETDVVRASLLLTRIFQGLGDRNEIASHQSACLSPAEAIFACMKVFMLEHGQHQGDSGDEVFRDSWIMRWMEDLLAPFAYSSASNVPPPSSTQEPGPALEHVSRSFLGAGTPFYQFYTDFLALYDAISFAHPLFGRLLLPPASMSYPVDYRRLLFGDFSHVLRTVRIDVQDVICGDVREYLWPVERDAHVIGWYLKALVTSDVQGFLRWIVVHHIALNIWPEFTVAGDHNHERAAKLLSAVVQRGSKEAVREVALYCQVQNEAWVPPKCFIPEDEKAWKQRRLEWIERVGGEGVKAQLQGLFLE